ncbi:MAG: RluA family pseudouridine synthase [bacterium]|nr:RluA family pseudouridine synthase [bacterium]
MPKSFKKKISKEKAGKRLDIFLAEVCNQSRNFWQKEIKNSNVKLDNKPAKAHTVLKAGQIVEFVISKKRSQIKEEKIKPEIIYEDKDLLAINKPAGLLVYAPKDKEETTIVSIFRNKVTDYDKLRPGIVHRLDRDTSGIMLIAKNPQIKKYLTGLFKKRQIKKTYKALIWGKLRPAKAKLELPIARDISHRHRMAVSSSGKQAVSFYKVIKEYKDFSLVEIELITGRTHQIRAQFKYLGHPVVGDKIYGRKETPGLKRQFLHAAKIEFKLPNGEQLTLKANLPTELNFFLNSL